jgi:peptide-methionine (S)-S-oxide reductase
MDKNSQYKKIVFGMGCFWCTEAVFKRLKGVLAVTPGYAGGHVPSPNYEQICSGTTGHAEVAQVEYDPAIISYEQLVEIYFTMHDPTTVNRQGHDIGEQYRSVIFYTNGAQKKIAEQVRARFDQEHIYKDPIVTQIEPLSVFYPAEDYHREYFEKNRYKPYCIFVINPKIAKLRKKFRDYLID